MRVLPHRGGGFHSEPAKVIYQKLQLAEKVRKGMISYRAGTAGHGSMPREDNAIVHLSAAVARIAQWQPPMRLNDVTRRLLRTVIAGLAAR